MTTLLLIACLVQSVEPLWPASGGFGQDLRWGDGDLRYVTGRSSADAYGYDLCTLEDLDGDGVAEVAVGAPTARGVGGEHAAGRVEILSGRSLELHSTLSGTRRGRELGKALAFLGGSDGRVPALVIGGAPGVDLRVVSIADGRLLYRVGVDELFGLDGDIASVGDLNDDGVEDFACTCPHLQYNGADVGGLSVFSGADGARLGFRAGHGAGEQLGTRLLGGEDLDGDETPDLVVAAARGNLPRKSLGIVPGLVRAYSGADGSELWETVGASPRQCFGRSMGYVNDVDGDGCREILIGSPTNELTRSAPSAERDAIHGGTLVLLSGRTGARLRTFDGTEILCDDGFDLVPRSNRLDHGLAESMAIAGERAFVGAYTAGWSPVLAVSTRTGDREWSFKVPLSQHTSADVSWRLGAALAVVGDVDGDGVEDVLASAVDRCYLTNTRGQVILLSGWAGTPIARRTLGQAGPVEDASSGR